MPASPATEETSVFISTESVTMSSSQNSPTLLYIQSTYLSPNGSDNEPQSNTDLTQDSSFPSPVSVDSEDADLSTVDLLTSPPTGETYSQDNYISLGICILSLIICILLIIVLLKYKVVLKDRFLGKIEN